MKKVTTINLSGKAVTVEEGAYDLLRTYLDKAAARLADDPDKTEILSDLEQAVADKCALYIRPGKDVVLESEVQRIITEMGPVAGAAASDADKESAETDTFAATGRTEPKRLFRLPEGQMIAGVCSGLAVYFNIDVTIVRVLFVLLAIMTSGAGAVLYLVMAIIVPRADTPEQRAELFGRPFNADAVITAARQRAADIQPALSGAGRVIGTIGRAIALVVLVGLAMAVGFLCIAAGSMVTSVVIGEFRLADQLQSVPMWAVIAAIAATAVTIAVPLIVLAQGLYYFVRERSLPKQGVWGAIIAVAAWSLAVSTLAALGMAYGSKIEAYVRTHDTVRVYGREICINERACGSGFYDSDGMPGWDGQRRHVDVDIY